MTNMPAGVVCSRENHVRVFGKTVARLRRLGACAYDGLVGAIHHGACEAFRLAHRTVLGQAATGVALDGRT